jgi:8-oxo-dGTP pyrophosphatase MutT (NUDIX family)
LRADALLILNVPEPADTSGAGFGDVAGVADAAVREMWEETGLLVEPVRIPGVYGGPEFQVTYSNGDKVSYLMIVFECRVTGVTIRPDRVETLELGYFSRPTRPS